MQLSSTNLGCGRSTRPLEMPVARRGFVRTALPVIWITVLAVVAYPLVAGAQQGPPRLSPIESLGKTLFNDATLSSPTGQSCASCHAASAGFTFPQSEINRTVGVAPGAVRGRFGLRAVPQISYSAFSPGAVHYNPVIELYVGGQFWDGRADSLEDQVHFPLVNPNEMNNLVHNTGSLEQVVQKVKDGPSAPAFQRVFGHGVFEEQTQFVFKHIADAIAAYERSSEVSPFSSKYDAWRAGRAQLTDHELLGLHLVTGTWSGRPDGATFPIFAHCGDCHMVPSVPSAGPDLWTSTCYQNIGVPRNPHNPFYTMTDPVSNPVGYNHQGRAFVDYGLGVTFYTRLGLPPGNIGPGSDGRGDFYGVNGQFKAPSLRNVDLRPYPGFVKAYMHNGVLKSLEEVVHFYNTRNLTTHPGEVVDFTRADPYAGLIGTPLWGEPEYPSLDTLLNPDGQLGILPGTGTGGESSAQVGNLGIDDNQEAAIVAFLKTLSDGYFDPNEGHNCIWVTSQPVPQRVCRGGSVRIAIATGGAEPESYRWRKNGVVLPDETTSFFTIVEASAADAGSYDCVITSACGQVTTMAADLLVCAGDFNCDGRVDPSDYIAFIIAYQTQDSAADVNGDGVVDPSDFAAFLAAYQQGC